MTKVDMSRLSQLGARGRDPVLQASGLHSLCLILQ